MREVFKRRFIAFCSHIRAHIARKKGRVRPAEREKKYLGESAKRNEHREDRERNYILTNTAEQLKLRTFRIRLQNELDDQSPIKFL